MPINNRFISLNASTDQRETLAVYFFDALLLRDRRTRPLSSKSRSRNCLIWLVDMTVNDLPNVWMKRNLLLTATSKVNHHLPHHIFKADSKSLTLLLAHRIPHHHLSNTQALALTREHHHPPLVFGHISSRQRFRRENRTGPSTGVCGLFGELICDSEQTTLLCIAT